MTTRPRGIKVAAVILVLVALVGIGLLSLAMADAQPVHVMPDGTTMPADEMR